MNDEFEYCVVYDEYERREAIGIIDHSALLNKKGKDGWELINIIHIHDYHKVVYYFKRKKAFNPTKRK